MSGAVEIDISQFKAAFFEEALDNASVIEATLLELEQLGGEEALHKIFRAAHSIKGGSGTFGLERLQAFTHALETLLDRLREGAVALTRPVMDLLFEGSDALRELIEAERSGQSRGPTLEALVGELLAAASAARPAAAPPSAPAAARAAPATAGHHVTDERRTSTARVYRIRFVPDPDLFQRGLDPVLLLRDLASLGELTASAIDTSALPALTALDPERCFLGWDLELRSERDEAAVKDVFSFVEDTSTVQIAELSPAPAAAPARSPAAAHASEPAPTRATSAPSPEVAPAAPAPGAGEARPAAAQEPAGSSGGTLRVAVDKLDKLVNLVGELVIAQAVLSQAVEDTSPDAHARMREAVQEMERHTRELQERVLSVRMIPIWSVFNRFQRLVRDLGQHCGKRIRLALEGGETEMDKGIVEQLADPLTHLIRNAIDHGLETPEDRLARGKPEAGTLRLTAAHQGGSVVIEVCDDGRGISWERVREKGIAQGLLAPSATPSEEELKELIFMPGFSTAASVTDISGRGVGMDVVRRNIDALGGALTLASEPGRGTRVRIKLPLTLAIVDGLTLRIGTKIFVLPLLSIIESFRPEREQLKTVLGSGELVRVRGEPIPLVRLYRVLGLSPDHTDPCQGLVVIVEGESQKLGLLVDEIVGQSQVVVKSLEANYRKVEGLMGATILGDGRVGLILDVEAIARGALAGRHEAPDAQEPPGAPERERRAARAAHRRSRREGTQHGSL